MRISLGNINSKYDGFNALIKLYQLVSSCSDRDCSIDMSSVGWMDANMCAPLGAVLFNYSLENKIILPGMSPKLQVLLQRNGFLPNFGFDIAKIPDTTGTTIEYIRFTKEDVSLFRDYVANHFVGKGIPDMSPQLHRKFRESISEIFENAAFHSGTANGIFACGQYFPKDNRLDFSIADLGIGFSQKIKDGIGKSFDDEVAIKWATSGNNTTRQREDGRPGGLGLKLLKEFIELNSGIMQIVSYHGYWRFERGEVMTSRFPAPFPGTVVNIEINTADKQSYCLASELDADDIF